MSKKDKERTIQMCHRLADVSLKTSASMLAIIFAYTFAMSGELGSLSPELKFYILFLTFGIFLDVVLSLIALFGTTEARYVKLLAAVSGIGMLIILLSMIALLSIVLL